MTTHRLLSAVVAGVCAVGIANAQEPAAEKLDKIQKTIDAIFQGHKSSVWESVRGDVDNDGIEDLVAVAVATHPEGPREERLLVLRGSADGNFTPLAISGAFCGAGKFYNLSAAKGAFDVQAVGSADATHSNSFTLRFKYSAKARDFELVGKEENAVQYDAGSEYRVSVNYLTGLAIQTRSLGKNYIERRIAPDGTEQIIERKRRLGKHRQVSSKFKPSALFTLQGFDCSRFEAEDPAALLPIYLDENFKIHNRQE